MWLERVANSVDEVGEDNAAVSSIGSSKEDHEEELLNVRKRATCDKKRMLSCKTPLKISLEPLDGRCPVQAVGTKTQKGAIKCNVADLRKLLASAVKMV